MLLLMLLLPLLLLPALPVDKLDCHGPFYPTPDHELGTVIKMEFDVAVATRGTSDQVVLDRAKDMLVEKLCPFAERNVCSPLRAKLRPWQTGETGNLVCAMVMIPVPDVEAWRRANAPDLDAALDATIKSLVTGEEKAAVKVLSFAEFTDMGVPGGVRAAWLVDRVASAVTRAGLKTLSPDPSWKGGLPKGADGVLRARISDVTDAASASRKVEVVLSLQTKSDGTRTARPLQFPAFTAPAAPTPVALASAAPEGLSLVVQRTRPGGGVCPGDSTDAWVTNESSKPTYVRVFNLDDKGTVLAYGLENNGLIPGHAQRTLAPDGVSIQSPPGSAEKFVAVGAPTLKELGPLANINDACRVSRESTKKLESLIQSFKQRGETGFRVLDDTRCGKASVPPEKGTETQSVDELPLCKL